MLLYQLAARIERSSLAEQHVCAGRLAAHAGLRCLTHQLSHTSAASEIEGLGVLRVVGRKLPCLQKVGLRRGQVAAVQRPCPRQIQLFRPCGGCLLCGRT